MSRIRTWHTERREARAAEQAKHQRLLDEADEAIRSDHDQPGLFQSLASGAGPGTEACGPTLLCLLLVLGTTITAVVMRH